MPNRPFQKKSPLEHPSPIVPLRRRKLSRRTVLTGFATLGGVSVAGAAAWCFFAPHPLFTYRGHTEEVTVLAWSPDSQRIASGSDDTTVQIWEALSGTRLSTYHAHARDITDLAWSPDGKYLALASTDQEQIVRVWNAADGTLVSTCEDATGPIVWSPDGKRIASGSWTKQEALYVWDVASGTRVANYSGPPDAVVQAIKWLEDNLRVISLSNSTNTVWIWDTDARMQMLSFPVGPSIPSAETAVDSLAWSPDGRRIATATWDTVQLWNAGTGSLLWTYTGLSGMAGPLAWSPDGKHLAVVSQGHYHEYIYTVQVLDAATSAHVYTYRGHTNYWNEQFVNAVAWSPDGKYIASGGVDKTVQVWTPG